MLNSMGMESSVLMRLNMPAFLPAAAFWSAGRSGYLPPMFNAFCWLGQITNQTLNHMMVPSHMPMPMARYLGTIGQPAVPSLRSSV